MSSGSEKSVIRIRTPPNLLRLSYWPLRDEPLQCGLIVGLLVAVSALSGIVTQRWMTAPMVFFLLNLTISRLWLSVEYEFGPKGIIYSWLGHRRRIAWSDIARFESFEDGVLLCADRQPLPFSLLRCMFIRWNGRRHELAEILEYYLSAETLSAGTSTQSYQRLD
jgi:hypothetical protein